MQIKIGQQELHAGASQVEGAFTKLDGADFYKISQVDQMPPFFMTLVSPFDHWLFIGSNGGLTAGRQNADKALFPYYTDDKIIDNAAFTGPRTLMRIKESKESDTALLWEPFDDRARGMYRIERNLYKSIKAEQLQFEEINHDLKLRFAYRWGFSQTYGFVRECWLENLGSQARFIECLDGVENILPFGVDGLLQDSRSNLVDAYKKNELDQSSGLGVFSLSSNIVDKAEPSEALRANVVWSTGEKAGHLLSSRQLEQFRLGANIETETFTKASKAAFFGLRELNLAAGTTTNWLLVADVALSSAKVINLREKLLKEDLVPAIQKELKETHVELEALVAKADGLQYSADKLVQTRHYGNVLYNIMRGGIFEGSYELDAADFKEYLKKSNTPLYDEMQAQLTELPEHFDYSWFQTWLLEKGNADLRRLGVEYLPLSFSRRHGDPSRPWNRFNIQRFDENGDRILNYEGNWRDIFQNWEALAYSYPRFIEGMIFKFLNASTIDGYNPYRIEKNGIDWEIIEPHDPWSFIGYWGDHQIIYLLRLLEHCEAHYPGMLKTLTKEFSFVYADVPYRIKSYADILKDPQDTIDFDEVKNREAQARYAKLGTDGKLIWTEEKAPLRANLAEKLLLTTLTKMYNLVPGGGVWMNTQRPEWNDANNALVGNGLSMVTLYYLRRFLRFIERWLAGQEEDLHVNGALMNLFLSVSEVVNDYYTKETYSTEERKDFVDRMGMAGERYREAAYNMELGASQSLGIIESREFCARTIRMLDRWIAQNEKDNGLYHAYNLLKRADKGMELEYLYEMLEGQVGVLTSEYLSPEKAVSVLDGLKASAMFRTDQYSYMLYPNRDLGTFLEKNKIKAEKVEGKKLTNRLLERDSLGDHHFLGHFNNAKDLSAELELLSQAGLATEVEEESPFWLDLFEENFIHRAFTGRSGTFYGFEGLGSIYWHMVSKLLLAVQENLRAARKQHASEEIIGRLTEHYYEIRAGIGANKPPQLYGAFPFDAYSHTPSTAGAKQPGMTGQVKEDIISRWAELGIEVNHGEIHLDPFFLSDNEFLNAPSSFRYLDANEEWQELPLAEGELAFTYCAVPFVFSKANQAGLSISMSNGEEETLDKLVIPAAKSAEIFKRNGAVKIIRAQLA